MKYNVGSWIRAKEKAGPIETQSMCIDHKVDVGFWIF